MAQFCCLDFRKHAKREMKRNKLTENDSLKGKQQRLQFNLHNSNLLWRQQPFMEYAIFWDVKLLLLSVLTQHNHY